MVGGIRDGWESNEPKPMTAHRTDDDERQAMERRVIEAAKKLTSYGEPAYSGRLTYDRPRGDDTPIPTCVGCNESSWGEIHHRPNCTVEDLIAAVRALRGRDP
jgi:hypothetical protein